MENPQEGGRFSDDGSSGVSSEPRVSFRVDLAGKIPELETRASGLVKEEAMMEAGGDDDVAYIDGDNRVSFVELTGWMNGFRIGDMVWGKVKSHPWWPGQIFNVSFASPSVRRMSREGFVLVAFFGDSSCGWFDPAELIPFEPHFPEKSRQTTSRSFVKAVEEAVDEASRRGALAVACRCRNLHNIWPTTVAGYFYVDVVGYEPGGIYSSKQIKKSRDSLVPVELLSFVRRLALDARGNKDNSIEWIQTIAQLLAYRRAVFEEYVETYAQAFGVEPVRLSPNSMIAFDQTDRFAPQGAPLSGPLEIAESLGERTSTTRQVPHKPTNSGKKNKYVLRRRHDLPTTSAAAAAAASSSLPDLPSSSQLLQHCGFFASLPDSTGPLASAMDPDYVLRKRENLPPPSYAVTDLQSTTEAALPPGHLQKSEPVELEKEGELLSESIVHPIPMESSQNFVDGRQQMPPLQALDDVVAVVKKEMMLKRPREDLNERGEVKRKKKKKKDGIGANQFPATLDADQSRLVTGRSIGNVDLLTQDDDINMELPPWLDLTSLQLPQLISDLFSIALDPFYAIERDAPAIVRHVFLRFRSMVYQKTLSLSSSMETAAPSQPSSVGREGREHAESSFSSKPTKAVSRLGVQTRASHKWDPCDHQEELWVKKMDKMNQLKQLAGKKKKAAISQKSLGIQQPKDRKDIKSSATATEASRKQERPPSPKLPSPTFLIMKFPPRSILPSVSNLKARYTRFGPLDLSGTRVSWRNHTCKVLFKHKSDAQSAFNFVQSNGIFGQAKVTYFLKDHEVSGPDQPLSPQNKPSDSSRPDKHSLQYCHGGTNIQNPSFSQAQQSQIQLKSILKKPVGDDSGSNSAVASISITRESPRVKFMLNGEDDRSSEPPPPPPPLKLFASSNNGGGQASPKSTEFFSPPLSQPLQPPSCGLETHPYLIPPPSPAPSQMLPPHPPHPQTLPSTQPRATHFPLSRGILPPLAPSNEPREKMIADISGQMLGLLQRCNDIVSNVSWNGLGNMASTEAMRLFVKILEEEDPAWYSRVPEPTVEHNFEMHKPKVESSGDTAIPDGISFSEPKHISREYGGFIETQDKDIIMEGLGAIGVYDQWVAPPISGQQPKPRYQHGAAVVKDKMYIFGGNHNSQYLNDLQVLDLKSLMWSKIDAKVTIGPSESSTPAHVAPLAGHSLISWDDKILSIAGHTKDPCETVTVKQFDPQTFTWSNLRTYGKPPISRGGQSVTLVGTTLVMFGGEDAKRSLLNDLHILDLETMTWDDIDAIGTPPSPRSDHAAACHAERHLLIFGGGSHATCFNDLHVLDLQNMEWSRPTQQGAAPGPRAGHAGIKVGENWFIVGGGDNKNGVSETLILHMPTLVWTVVTSVQGRVPLASEGLSVALSTCNGEDYLVSFGGYNGRYNNEVYVLKPSYKSYLQSKIFDKPTSDSMTAVIAATNVGRDVARESEVAQDGKITEIMMDNVDSGPLHMRTEESGEHIITALKAEKEELEVTLNREQLQNLQLKQELAEAETKNVEISKELQSLRGQLAAEQSRCFKLEQMRAEESGEHFITALKAEKEELEVTLNRERLQNLQLKQELAEAVKKNAEISKELQFLRGQLAAEQSRCFKLEVDLALHQKLQNMETLQKEVELLQRQKAAFEQAALSARQRQNSDGVWGWHGGNPAERSSDDS